MTPYDDDEDWVGTPPEGRYSRDRARPEFWWRQRPVLVAGVGIVIALVPVSIWISAVLGSSAAVLSLILLARARSLALVK